MAVTETDPIGGVIPLPPPLPDPPPPTIVAGGASRDAQVLLIDETPEPLTITFTSTYPLVAFAETPTLTFAAGESAKLFRIVTNDVTHPIWVSIGGYSTKGVIVAATFVVLPSGGTLDIT